MPASTSGARSRRGNGTRSPGFVAGMTFVLFLLASGAGSLIYLGYTHWPASFTEVLKNKLGYSPTLPKGMSAQQKGELDGKTLFAHLFYKGAERPVQTWELLFHDYGDRYNVDITDVTSNNKMRGTALMQVNALVINYASMGIRPGYGTLTMRRKLTNSATDPLVFAGGGRVHDCGCPENEPRYDGPLWDVPALLTTRKEPTKRERQVGLSKDGQSAVVIDTSELSDVAQQ